MTESCILPAFNIQQAAIFLSQVYGIEGSIDPLNGERDLNFKVVDNKQIFVFKIANIDESRDMLECQHQIMQRLHACNDNRANNAQPRSVESLRGNIIEEISSTNGEQHLCRVVTYVDGLLFSSINPHTDALLQNLGEKIGILDSILWRYQHKAVERPLLWNMNHALETMDRFMPLITDDKKTALLRLFRDRFVKKVLPVSGQLRSGMIHNDVNDNNIVVDISGPDNKAYEQTVKFIIDFGDVVYSWIVVDPAVATAYAILGKARPLDAAVEIICGYHRRFPLTEVEISVLFELICMRLCLSVCICAHQKSREPGNDYLSISEKPAWDALALLSTLNSEFVHYVLRDACGLEPVPMFEYL